MLRNSVLGLSLLSGASMICLAMPAQARPIRIDMPAQSLSAAITDLALQAQVQIVFDKTMLEGRRAPAVQGSYETGDVLLRLLSGTGLAPSPTRSGFILVPEAKATRTVAMATMAEPAVASAPAAAPPDPAEEIVVTGNKLGSNLERAPVAVSALSSEVLENNHVQSIQGVQVRVPSLVYNATSNFAQAFIRGIGNNFSLAGTESSVATYVDGVYLQRQAGAVLDVVDLKTIQVLKGPQGTLYGRNATGGAILVETNDPTDRLEGRIAAEYGRFDHAVGQAMINVPVSDTVSIRLAGKVETRGGWLRDFATGKDTGELDSQFVRAKIAWRPSPDFTAIYGMEYSHRSSIGFIPHEKLSAPLCTVCAISGVNPPDDFYSTTRTPVDRGTGRYFAQTLRLSATLGQFEINSITGLRTSNVRNIDDQEHMPFFLLASDVVEKGPTFVQDLYVRTKMDGPLNILIGSSYERERATLDVKVIGAAVGTGLGTIQKAKIDSVSVYGDIYYDITPELKLTLGARYNHDHKQLSVDNDANSQAAYGFDQFALKKKFNDVTPHAILSYDGPGGYYYASYSRGAKSGGFSSPTFTPVDPLQSEKLDSFELGAKNHFLDGAIRTNAAIFYGRFTNIQVQLVDINAGTVVSQNAAKAELYGAEADIQWRVSSALDLAVGGTYLHNKFLNYSNAAVFVPAPEGSPGLVNGVEDLSGRRLPRSPRFSGYASIDYTGRMNSGWTAGASLVARYTSSFDFLAGAGGPLRLDRQGAYTKMDGSLSLTTPDEMTEFGVYMDNMLGQKYADFAATSAFGAYYVPAMRRTFGARISRKF